jgi:hypothetical protein
MVVSCKKENLIIRKSQSATWRLHWQYYEVALFWAVLHIPRARLK